MGLRFLFWIETTFAAVSAVLFALALVWPQWIESVFGVDPDRGSGGAEWGIALGLLALTFAFAALARSIRRRLMSA